jgi:CRP/FNR family cyclic AMP-dependent transcriptional regulator
MAASEKADPGRRWVRRLEAGETLFEEGDIDEKVYILIEGRVEVLRGSTRVAEIDVGDTFIGEISALTGHPRTATVRTLRKSTLLVVGHIEDLFMADSTWGIKLARVLAERLERMDELLSRVQSQLQVERRRTAHEETQELLADVYDSLKKAGDLSSTISGSR